MSKKIDQKRRQYWLEKINAWKSSGKSGLSWCKENNINNRAFYRWRSFFSNQPSLKLNPESFIELENKTCFSLDIEYEKYKFNLKDFSFSELNNFLKILKSL